jgi:hypothetical protein
VELDRAALADQYATPQEDRSEQQEQDEDRDANAFDDPHRGPDR